MGRKRFVPPGDVIADTGSIWFSGMNRRATPLKLLFVHAAFTWKGEVVRVTSFNDADGTMTACSYVREDGTPADTAEQKWGDKIHHRYTITPKDLREAAAELKAASKAETAAT
jgi:hypothetical protein